MSVRRLAAEILELSKELGALTFGDFTLSSGLKSSYYFDGRRLTLDAKGCYLVGQALFEMLRGTGIEAIGGPTLGADPMVAAAALTSHRHGEPMSAFIVRKDAKGHGAGRIIEGPLRPGSRVAIVDDACSTGGSLFHAIEAAEAEGCRVAAVVAILDRRQGGSEELRRRGYRFIPLLEATDRGEITVAAGLGD